MRKNNKRKMNNDSLSITVKSALLVLVVLMVAVFVFAQVPDGDKLEPGSDESSNAGGISTVSGNDAELYKEYEEVDLLGYGLDWCGDNQDMSDEDISAEMRGQSDKAVNRMGNYGTDSYKAALHYWDDKVEGVDYYWLTLPDFGAWRFDQAFAREELFPRLYFARFDGDNHWYCKNDAGEDIEIVYTGRVGVDGNGPKNNLVYDYELERCAMQRALECALYDGWHKRPDGQSADEAYIDLDSPYQYVHNSGELYDAGCTWTYLDAGEYEWNSADAIVDLFMEEYDDEVMCYARQNHRRAILGVDGNEDNYRIGIGVVRTNDVFGIDGTKLMSGRVAVSMFLTDDTWEYDKLREAGKTELWNNGYIPLYDTETEAVNTYKALPIRVANNMGNLSVNGNGQVSLMEGETYDLNDKVFYSYDMPYEVGIGKDTGLYSTDISVATVTNGVIRAVGPGECQILSDFKSREAAGGSDKLVPAHCANVVVREDPNKKKEQNDETGSGGSAVNFNTVPNPVPQPAVTGPDGSVSQSQPTPSDGKKKQSIKLKKVKYTFSAKNLKKSSKKFRIKPTVNGGKAHGTISYKVKSYPSGAKKYIKVDKKGNVTLKKKAKKGTYKVEISASETVFLKSATKTVTIKVK